MVFGQGFDSPQVHLVRIHPNFIVVFFKRYRIVIVCKVVSDDYFIVKDHNFINKHVNASLLERLGMNFTMDELIKPE